MIEILPLENKERENELLSPLGETSDTAKIFMSDKVEANKIVIICTGVPLNNSKLPYILIIESAP